MSALSKVFVVLISFLSVAVVALLVPNVANQHHFREEITGLKDALRAAETAAAVKQRILAMNLVNESEVVTTLRSELATVQKDLDIERQKNAQRNVENQTLNRQLELNKAENRKLSTSIETFSSLLKEEKADLTSLRRDYITLQTQNIELGARIEDLDKQLDLSQVNVKSLKEINYQLEQEVKKYKELWKRVPYDRQVEIEKAISGLGGGGVADEGVVRSTVVIRGLVRRVQQQGDNLFVQINVGSQDGVLQNMVFRVHRGSTFLGNLKIRAVDERTATGIVIQRAPNTVIVENDKVLTGPTR